MSRTNRPCTIEKVKKLKNILRGDIFYADSNPVIGSEQGGYRPVLIIQNNTGNRFSLTVIVAAISGRAYTKVILPTHVEVWQSGLKSESVILLEQVRTINKQRLCNYIGNLDRSEMEKVDRRLKISLGIV